MKQYDQEIYIYDATESDLPVILDIQKRAFHGESALYDFVVLPPMLETIDDLKREMMRGVLIKAVRADTIVGSVRAYQEGRTCYIGRLVVEPELQNQGIGRKLMEKIEAYFSCDRFELFTGHRSAKSIALYEKLGYRRYKENFADDNVRLVYLEKRKAVE